VLLPVPPATEIATPVRRLPIADQASHVRRVDSAAGERHELRRLAAVQRQADDLLLAHDQAHAGTARLDLARIPRDGDRFLNRADFQCDLDRARVADGEHDASLLECREALKFGGQAVRTNRQVREDVLAARAGDHKPGHSSAGLRDGDLDTGKRAARLVDDGS